MKAEYARSYGYLRRHHWWWQARDATLVVEIERLGLPPAAQILDLGCGDGMFLEALSRFGAARGIEVDRSLVAPDNPWRDFIDIEPLGSSRYEGRAYDLITALDVIEHIEDDAAAIRHLREMLVDDGRLLLTVPAGPELWTRHDEINLHHRRYTRASLSSLLAGFRIERLRHLFPSLYLPRLLIARLESRGSEPASRAGVRQHAIPPAPVNWLASRWCRAENRLCRLVPFPVGTSLLAVARRLPGR